MATRNRTEEKKYKAYLKTLPPNICVFCDIKNSDKSHIQSTKYCRVIENIFPYSLWEYVKVSEHLMITPLRHVSSLGDLNDKELLDYMKLLGAYEKRGYNLYARAPSSPTKSIPHQHFHLIKTTGKQRRITLHSKKPAYRLSF